MRDMADQLDELYDVTPDQFTALRTTLASAAKELGDTDTAKEVAAARKPTVAAWVVNRLVLRDRDTMPRLTGLGDRLRDAHSAMDGGRIRQLSGEQRRLVDDLVRLAFEEAELAEPSAALRDDVTGTLQAAIADPDVASRLGRLTKAEQWSGFGDVGAATIVLTASRGEATSRAKPAKAAAAPPPDPQRDDDNSRRRATARAALAAAERAKADADAALTALQSDLATARLRREDARRRLRDAEEALTAADDAYELAKRASREAMAVVKEAKAQLR
jgi:hypothetical protein